MFQSNAPEDAKAKVGKSLALAGCRINLKNLLRFSQTDSAAVLPSVIGDMRARGSCVVGAGATGCGGISQPGNEYRGRRTPAPTEILGDPEPSGRACSVSARQRDREYCLAGDRQGNPRQR